MLYGRQRTGFAIPFITERNFVVDRKKFAFYMCCETFAFKYICTIPILDFTLNEKFNIYAHTSTNIRTRKHANNAHISIYIYRLKNLCAVQNQAETDGRTVWGWGEASVKDKWKFPSQLELIFFILILSLVNVSNDFKGK